MAETARLLEAALSGDRAARDELLGRHTARLAAFLRVRASPALARRVPPDDLVQDTLLEAVRKLETFEPRGDGSFYRWLAGIARRKLLEAGRARVAEELGERDPPREGTGVVTVAARAERAGRLRAALEELPEAQAEAIRLRYLEGLSTREAAERLERSEGAVKMLLSRGFAALAGRLAARV